MKLPAAKNERIKIYVLIAISSAGVLYALWSVVISSMIAQKRKLVEQRTELTENVQKAERRIGLMRSEIAENLRALQSICDETDRYVLRSTLGDNYILGVTEKIEQLAKAAGVVIDPPTQAGISDVPQNAGRASRNVLRLYTARISMSGGLPDVIRLLRQIDASSPYVCVSALSIAGQPETPETHRVTMDVQWPIWVDKDTPEALKRQMAEYASMQHGGANP
jgi:hypothetical protein